MNRHEAPFPRTSFPRTAATRASAWAAKAVASASILISVFFPRLAHAETDGGTEVTIRRLEDSTAASPLAQTGIGGQAWLLILAGLVLVCLALLCLAISRRRHGSH